jgi:hypothetical protein
MVDYSLLNKDLENFFVGLFDIGFVIVSPIICIIGLILNILCCIVFFNLKEKIFFYLGFKSLAESLFLMIRAISPYLSCFNCDLDNTYVRMLIIFISRKFLELVIYSLITILEIEISFNRYFLVNSHKTKLLIEKKDKIKISVYIVVSILMFIPCLFAYEIKRMMPFAYEYILAQNGMGKNLIYMNFYSFFYLLANIVSILILLPLNIIILLKFKKFIKNKSAVNTLVRQENNASRLVLQENAKAESRFTRMIVFISFLFIFSRLCEASVAFFVIYNDFNILNEYFKLFYSILSILVFVFNNLIFSINFLIFYFFNNTFVKKFNEIFCCKK